MQGLKSRAADSACQSRSTTETTPGREVRRRPQPRFHVVLWDDDDHTYDYVMRMMRELFGHEPTRGFEIADRVDRCGRAVCLTTTREHAELKRDQILAYGGDRRIPRCAGSMFATIEPEG